MPAGGFTFPLIVWLALQLGAIALTTSRFPLWANYPRTFEQLTLQALLVTQIVTAALLFPFLLQDLRSTIAVVATSVPFALIAAAISSTAISQTFWSAGYVVVWVISLGAWVPNLRSAGLKRAGIALATSVALTGPVLLYLQADYGSDRSANADRLIQLLPTGVVHKILLEKRPYFVDWTVPSLLVVSAAATAVLRRVRTRCTA